MAHIRTSHSAMNEALCSGAFVYSRARIYDSTLSVQIQPTALTIEARCRYAMYVFRRCAPHFSRAVKIIHRLFTYTVHGAHLHLISHHVAFGIEINGEYSERLTNFPLVK